MFYAFLCSPNQQGIGVVETDMNYLTINTGWFIEKMAQNEVNDHPPGSSSNGNNVEFTGYH